MTVKKKIRELKKKVKLLKWIFNTSNSFGTGYTKIEIAGTRYNIKTKDFIKLRDEKILVSLTGEEVGEYRSLQNQVFTLKEEKRSLDLSFITLARHISELERQAKLVKDD